jgi:hypothetical protein
MSFNEEKEFIFEIARKYFPNRVADLVVLNMEEEADNVSLFSGLRDQ